MLKSLWLSILGWFRAKAEANTDLRYAGKEHIANVKSKIEDVRAQRNNIAGSHLLLGKKVTAAENAMNEAKEAVRHWNSEGDQEKEDKAYALYTEAYENYHELLADYENKAADIRELDLQIADLEKETIKVKSQLDRAASTQLTGRARSAVESVHSDLTAGPLAGAIESAEHQNAVAEATRNARKAKDNSDVLNIGKKSAPSREELLK